MIRNVLIIGAGDSAAELLDHLVQTKLISLNKINCLFMIQNLKIALYY